LKKSLTIESLKFKKLGCKGLLRFALLILPLFYTQSVYSQIVKVNSATICTGSVATLTASGGSGTYVWSTGQTVVSITDNPTLTTSYTVTDVNPPNKKAVATIVVGTVAPVLTSTISIASIPVVGNSQTVCSGVQKNLDMYFDSDKQGSTIYSWFTLQDKVAGANPGTLPSSTTHTVQTIGSNPTKVTGKVTYTLIATDSGCVSAPDVYVFTVFPEPKVFTTPSFGFSICSGDTARINLSSAFGGTKIVWGDPIFPTAEANSYGATSGSTTDNAKLRDILYSDAAPGGGTTFYHFIPSANGCTGNAATVEVEVRQKPVVSFLDHQLWDGGIEVPHSQTICAGIASDKIIFESDMPTATYYAWFASTSDRLHVSNFDTIGTIDDAYPVAPNPYNVYDHKETTYSYGIGREMDTIRSEVYRNWGTTTETVTYTVYVNGCEKPAGYDTVFIHPTPHLNPTSEQSICSGDATSMVTLTSQIPATYEWYRTRTYKLNAFNHITNPIPTTTLWASTPTGIGVNILTIPSETIATNSYLPDTVTYRIRLTGTDYGCIDTSNSFVYIKPLPDVISTPATSTICSGGSVFISLSSHIVGTTFNWSLNQRSLTFLGGNLFGDPINHSFANNASFSTDSAIYTIRGSFNGCTGPKYYDSVAVYPIPDVKPPYAKTICSGDSTDILLTSNVAGTTYTWTAVYSVNFGTFTVTTNTLVPGNPNKIQEKIVSTAHGAGTATYSVVPTANGCVGNPYIITVTVNPLPDVFVSDLAPSICSGDATSIIMNGQVTGTSFIWTPVDNNTLGSSGGNGASPLTQTLTTSPLPYVFGTTTYSIIPTANGCFGLPLTVTVTVNPIPNYTATTTPTVCSGVAADISLSGDVINTDYFWSETHSANLTNMGLLGASTNTITANFVNSSFVDGTVEYTITPSANNCTGAPYTLTVTVSPLPDVLATDITVCSGIPIGLLSIPSSNIVGTMFTWSVTPNGVTGESSSAIALPSPIITLSTATVSVGGTATYSVTPTFNTCIGLEKVINVTVNPSPTLTVTTTSKTICTGTTTQIDLTDDMVGSTYSWTVSSIGVSGANSPGVGTPIAQTLIATGLLDGSATYTIVATNNSCQGVPVIETIYVTAIPTVTVTATAVTICSGGTTNIPLGGTATSFSWTVDQSGGGGVSGGVANSGANISQILTAVTNNVDGIATYSITPAVGLCLGTPITVSVTVNSLTITPPANATICSGTSTNITFPIPSLPTVFDWVVDASGLAMGGSNSSGPVINQVLTNATSSVIVATYTVTPQVTGCVGLPFVLTVDVNPIPNLLVTNNIPTICSGSATDIDLISNVGVATFDWAIGAVGLNPTVNVTNGSSPIAQILSASGIVAGIATYTITPKVGTCPGTYKTATVTVNPVTTATPSAPTICSGSAPNMTLTSPVLGTTFDWTVQQTNVSGASNVTNSNTINQVLTLIGASSGNVVYTVTPSASGCAGTPVNFTVIVNPYDDPSFNYASATFCKSGTDPLPIAITTPGGKFTATPVGLTLNQASGLITLSSSAVGIYAVKYVTNTLCKDSSIFNINITNTANATFTYTLSPICKNDANPVAKTFPGLSTPGIFTSTAGLVFANQFTGEIDLALTTPGTYSVVNTISSCTPATSDISIITILPTDDASFNYSSSTYCISGADPTPIVAGLSGGSFSSAPGGLSLNSSSGKITLATSALKTYTVTYTTNGSCQNTSTFGITISSPPKATFNYTNPYCQNGGGNASPSYPAGASAGLFSAPAGVVFANKFTGLVDLSLSTPGTYTVVNTIPNCAGGNLFIAQNTLIINGLDDASFNYSSGTFCQTQADPVPLFIKTPGGIFSTTSPNVVLSSATGQITLGASVLNVGTPYQITYTTNGVCPNSSTFGVTITNSTPPGTGFNYAASYCKNAIDQAPVFVPAFGASPGVFTSTPGLVFANKFDGTIDFSASTAGTYTITNNIGCNSATPSTDIVTINDVDDASFHYAYSTFCQTAAVNPAPTITGLTGGTFTSKPSGLKFVSAATGVIKLSTSVAGTYTVSYTNVGGNCPSTYDFVVNLTNQANSGAKFNYDGPYCQSSTPTALPTFPFGSFPGIFKAPVGLVFANEYTGLVDLKASTQGTYTVTNEYYNCSGNLVKEEGIIAITTFPNFTLPDVGAGVCEGQVVSTISFQNTTQTYFWKNTNAAIGLDTSALGNIPSFVATNTTDAPISGEITITSTLNGCVGSVVTYTVTVKPKIPVDAGADANVVYGSKVVLGGSPTGPAGSTYSWQPTKGFIDATYANPEMKGTTTTLYHVMVTNDGCTTTDSVLVSVMQKFAPPGGFTPNGDGINDTWIIDFLDFYPNNLVEIFNRWGELVFQSPGYTQKWDGTFNNKPLPVGTYYYIINLNVPEYPDPYTGPVSIVR
jgi:gliding motility-associated-like protein